MTRSLLINADDLGYDADTFGVTTRLMLEGAIRSATILTGYPETERAIAFARDHQREFSFGVHFNIAEGAPLARSRVPSLTGPDGNFRGPVAQRLRALTGMIRPEDIVAEAEAQLSLIADCGVQPSHLDSHGHLHKFPHVIRALEPVMRKFGISRVRLPQTSYDKPRFYNQLLDRHCTKAFHASRLRSADSFFNTRSHDEDWFESYLSRISGGVNELGVHPGSIEAWRAAEAAPLTTDLPARLARRGIALISYHEIGQ